MTRTSLLTGVDLPPVDADAAPAGLDVVRDPAAVAPHLRRIAAAPGADARYGALVDLFIGTPPSAHAERARALAEHGADLRPEQRAALAAAIGDGLRAAAPIPPAPWSLLTDGATSAAALVETAPAVVAPRPPVAAVGDEPATPARAPDTAPAGPAGGTSAGVAAPAHDRRRSRVPWAVAAALAAALAVGAAVVATRDDPAPTAAPTPTTAATAGPASTAGPSSTAGPAVTDPGPTATGAVGALYAALAEPAGSWDASAFSADSATAAGLVELRARLAADDRRLETDVESITVVATDRGAGADEATVTVAVRHDGAVLVTPDAQATWTPAGSSRWVVELTLDADGWEATRVTAAASG